jgi:hypothetical protein
LLVAGAGNRTGALDILRNLDFGATEIDDPYAAMAELCRRPLVYRAVILSLASLYREELSIIPAVKARFPHVEVWLAQTDGRQAALAEGMRLGADGLLAEDGLHRVAHPATPGAPTGTTAAALWTDPPRRAADASTSHSAPSASDSHADDEDEDALRDAASDNAAAGPVLTPAELRALLHEQSPVPPDDV